MYFENWKIWNILWWIYNINWEKNDEKWMRNDMKERMIMTTWQVTREWMKRLQWAMSFIFHFRFSIKYIFKLIEHWTQFCHFFSLFCVNSNWRKMWEFWVYKKCGCWVVFHIDFSSFALLSSFWMLWVTFIDFLKRWRN